MAHLELVQPGKPLRWIIEQGDLVFYRPSIDSRRWREARIPLMNRKWVYLASGEWIPGDPLGIGDGTEVWRVRTCEAHTLIVPREAMVRLRGQLYYNRTEPPILKVA